jgi:hypothetical protein
MCLPRSCAAAVVAAASRSGLEAGPEMAASDLVHCRVACSHHAAQADLCVCSLLLRKGSNSIVSRQSLKRSEECGGGQALTGSNAPATQRPQRCNERRGRRAACRRGVTTPPAVSMTDQRSACIRGDHLILTYDCRRSSTTRLMSPRQIRLRLQRLNRQTRQKQMRQQPLLQMTLLMQTMHRWVPLRCILWC